MFFDEFEQMVLETVDWTTSPGWPYRDSFSTNGELFGWDGVGVRPDRVMMMQEAVKQRIDVLRGDIEADPIYLFIKPEPHTKRKLDMGAYRLISGVGVIDRLVDEILYGRFLAKMVKNWEVIPNKAGWTPQMGGYRWVLDRIVKPAAVDKSAWDWTMQGWIVKILEKLLVRLMKFRKIRGSDVMEEYERILKNRFMALFLYPTYKTAGGNVVEQRVYGIQKSGCLGTIGFNSIAQVALHLLAVIRSVAPVPLPMALGDDTIQDIHQLKREEWDRYIEELGKTGCIIKEVEYRFLFAGHEMFRTHVEPCYREKHLYTLIYAGGEELPELLMSYQFLYGYSLDQDMRDVILELIRQYNPLQERSEAYIRNWYRGDEAGLNERDMRLLPPGKILGNFWKQLDDGRSPMRVTSVRAAYSGGQYIGLVRTEDQMIERETLEQHLERTGVLDRYLRIVGLRAARRAGVPDRYAGGSGSSD